MSKIVDLDSHIIFEKKDNSNLNTSCTYFKDASCKILHRLSGPARHMSWSQKFDQYWIDGYLIGGPSSVTSHKILVSQVLNQENYISQRELYVDTVSNEKLWKEKWFNSTRFIHYDDLYLHRVDGPAIIKNEKDTFIYQNEEYYFYGEQCFSKLDWESRFSSNLR